MKSIKFFCYNEINEKHFNGAVRSVQYALIRNLRQLGYEVETVDKCLSIFAFLKRMLRLTNNQDIVFTYEHIPLFSFTSYLSNMIGKVGYFLMGIMKQSYKVGMIICGNGGEWIKG